MPVCCQQGDELLLEGSNVVNPMSDPASLLRSYLHEAEGTIPNQLHLTGSSRQAYWEPSQAAAHGMWVKRGG